jgi:hypothetical protein
MPFHHLPAFINYYLEARSGIEPLNNCFADSRLTSWLPRRNSENPLYLFNYLVDIRQAAKAFLAAG